MICLCLVISAVAALVLLSDLLYELYAIASEPPIWLAGRDK